MFAAPVISDHATKSAAGLKEWNNIVGAVFAGCSVDAVGDRFVGELWGCDIDELKLVRVRAEASKVGRWSNGSPMHTSGSVLLHLQSSGRSINRQCGRSEVIEEGHGALCDPNRFYAVDFLTPYEMFVLELPITGILAREPSFDLERLAGQKLEIRRSQLLIAFLRAAVMQRDCLENDPDWRDCVSRTSLDLAMRAIIQADEHEVIGTSAELRRAVLDHIRRNLGDPQLRTSSIARALKVSPRTVQTVFERLATTTSGFILWQRLDRAAEQLIREPGCQSITDLSYSCGFSDSAYFSRCFRRRFGVPPRYYRRDGPSYKS